MEIVMTFLFACSQPSEWKMYIVCMFSLHEFSMNIAIATSDTFCSKPTKIKIIKYVFSRKKIIIFQYTIIYCIEQRFNIYRRNRRNDYFLKLLQFLEIISIVFSTYSLQWYFSQLNQLSLFWRARRKASTMGIL